MSEAGNASPDDRDARVAALLAAAMTAHRAGAREEAEEGYRAILELNPDHADALHLLAVSRFQNGAGGDAYDLVSRAISLRPDVAAYQNTLGTVLRSVQEYEKATQAFVQALRLQPDYRDARNNLALVLSDRKQFDDARTVLRDSLADSPDDPLLLTGMGRLHLLTDDIEAAVVCFHDALKIAPDHVGALNNIGVAFNLLNDTGGARASFERALELDPSHVDAHYNYAQLLLLLGDYAAAWPHFEWRLRRPDYRRKFSAPQWQGEPLDGRPILIWCEQGLGDAIHFIRYAPMVAERGGQVIVEAAKPLHRLIAGVPGVASVHEKGQLPAFDIQCPIMSLPAVFETTLESIPASVPYVALPTASVIDAPDARLKVGLIWAGNPDNARDRARSRTLGEFAPLAELKDIAFYSLQVGAGADDPAPPQLTIQNLMPTIKDFYDTAADMLGLDLIISVDSSSAHLAGAIGVPVWVLLDKVADWRWLEDGSETAWYPTMRLFRSTQGWPVLFQEVADALRRFEPQSVSAG